MISSRLKTHAFFSYYLLFLTFPQICLSMKETDDSPEMKLLVLVTVMMVLVTPSRQTNPSTESSTDNYTTTTTTTTSTSRKTCYKCYNCATFEQVQAKLCEPDEHFCSVRMFLLWIFSHNSFFRGSLVDSCFYDKISILFLKFVFKLMIVG